jgi:hypothetical protein
MLQSRNFHYGWIVVGVTCLALLTGAGVRSTPGILMVPLETEFGWSRATIALAVSINLILTAASARSPPRSWTAMGCAARS